MLELWEAFDLVQKVLLCMAVPATLLLVVELVLMLVGLAHGAGDADVSPDAGSADDLAAQGVDGTDVDGLDAHGLGMDSMDAHGLGVDGLDAHGLGVDGLDAHGLGVDGLDAHGLGAHDLDAHGLSAHDLDAHDIHDAQHARGELRWFTLVGMLSFFAITGWAGLALIDAALPEALAVPLATGLGVLAMYLCAVVMRWFGRLGEAGNVALEGAVGQFAEAYLPIAPGRAPGGKVSLTLQGRFLVLDAVTDAPDEIPTGARVVVTGLAGGDAVLVRRAREA